MRFSIWLALLFLSSTQGAIADHQVAARSEHQAQQQRLDEAEHAARMLELIEQLIESPDPTQQAAGLLMAEQAAWADWYTEDPLLAESEMLDRLHALIKQANTPLARTLLAQLCAMHGIQADCRRHGLDQAIVRLDGANLIPRLMLTEAGDQERVREIVIAAESIKEHHMDFALLLLDAMEAQGVFSREQLTTTAIVHGLFLSPPFEHLTRLCTVPATNDPELNTACQRLTHQMMNGTGSTILSMIGTAIMFERLAVDGPTDLAERRDQWRAAREEWMSCVGLAGEQSHGEADVEFTREFIQHWSEHGESSAQSMIAHKAGVDCGLFPKG